jgi:amino acid transporter
VIFGVAAIERGVNGARWSMTPFYNPQVFHIGLIFSALSVAVLSFLGFDAISTLAEETKGGPRVVGRATMIALCLSAALFVIQTYVAALLVPGKTEFLGDTAANEAFYTIAQMAGGGGFKLIVAVSVTLSTAIANALVAQAATSRLLFAMARDRQLTRFLAHVHPVRKVPERALLLVSAVSLVLGLFFVGQIGLISSLVNFGALFSFLLLHVAVVVYFIVRKRARTFGLHLVSPIIGFVIISYVLLNADIPAKVGGTVWLAIGVVILIGLRLAGRTAELDLAA